MSRANEPAYPVTDTNLNALASINGLTLREHFAGLAMQGLIAMTPDIMPAAVIARKATSCADALIAALNRPTSENCRGCDSPTCTGCGR